MSVHVTVPRSVTGIWRYPVKSMGGERLAAAHLNDTGIVGDRGWGVIDLTSGMVLTARRAPSLLFASARVDAAGDVEVTLPDGRRLGVGADGDRTLSDWLGVAVELRRAGDIGGIYENPLNVADEDDWVTWQGPSGAWHDSARARVSLVSEASLSAWDIRRFRTNVVLSGSDEDELVGASVELGGARLHVTKRIDRCIMVTRAQPGLQRDLGVLQTIHRDRGSCLSIGALVEREGAVAVGDQLTIVQ